MTRINILPPLVADMIAAGEVVERPASVIKELMENSFDAGASKVTVEFKSGGATYIKITDDGCGMSPRTPALPSPGTQQASCTTKRALRPSERWAFAARRLRRSQPSAALSL